MRYSVDQSVTNHIASNRLRFLLSALNRLDATLIRVDSEQAVEALEWKREALKREIEEIERTRVA